MTLTSIPAASATATSAVRRDVRAWPEHLAVVVALVVWGRLLTDGTGGRDRWVLTYAIAAAVGAAAIALTWRRVHHRVLAAAAVAGVAPVLVCLLDPTHWFGASQAATYPYSALMFVLVLGYARTRERRLVVVAVVLAAAVAQFAEALIPWIAGGDPSGTLMGTFGWYNPFAAFLLGPAVLGAGLAVAGNGPLRLAGAVVAAAGTAGVVLSTSRASILLLVAGWCVAAAVAILCRQGLRARLAGAGAAAAAGATAALVTTLLPGPPLFAHRVAALGATAARNKTQSVAVNGGFRLHFWHQALQLFVHRPLQGYGFGSFGLRAWALDPHASGHSSLVHSGFLQPLSDGGLLLGLPFLAASAAVGIGLLRRLRPSRLSADGGVVALTALAALVLAAHSAVDFDWSYPSLMALCAVLAAVALSSPLTPEGVATPARRSAAVAALAVLVSASVLLAVPAARGGWTLTAHPHTPSTTFLYGVTAP